MNTTDAKLLIVEDNEADALYIQELLSEDSRANFKFLRASRLEEAVKLCRKEQPDIVLLDLRLPDSDGIDTLTSFRRKAHDGVIIVLTGLENEELGFEALKRGAQDYIIKNRLSTEILSRAIRYAVERHRLLESVRELSLTDDLTGLLNRRGFFTLAKQSIRIARRKQQSICLLLLDLDGLKNINDKFGHSEGDRAIMATAEILRGTFRESDIIARLGGDEFVALAIESDPEIVHVVGKRIRDSVQKYNQENGHPFQLSLSMGAYQTEPGEQIDIVHLIQRADKMMYDEKKRKGQGHGKGEN